jgi:hypothetical protein
MEGRVGRERVGGEGGLCSGMFVNVLSEWDMLDI